MKLFVASLCDGLVLVEAVSHFEPAWILRIPLYNGN